MTPPMLAMTATISTSAPSPTVSWLRETLLTISSATVAPNRTHAKSWSLSKSSRSRTGSLSVFAVIGNSFPAASCPVTQNPTRYPLRGVTKPSLVKSTSPIHSIWVPFNCIANGDCPAAMVRVLSRITQLTD